MALTFPSLAVWILTSWHIYLVVAVVALSFPSGFLQTETRHAMTRTFDSFCADIGLSAPESSALRHKFEAAKGDARSVPANLDAFCTAMTMSLGPAKVDTGALNVTLVDQNWSAACISKPHCIVQLETAEDVSTTMKCITQFGVRFAIRSGGHSPNPGWSSIDNEGVLLDMQRLNQINMSRDGSSVSVGAGARWGDVYDCLDPYGISVIGGRVPDVGVAGLVLGGGFSYFTGEYGTAADNVKNFEVVLADGTINNANAHNNTDLFWALKGGGPNFGVVTRYDLFTIPVRDIWYQATVYSVDKADVILETYAKWQMNEGATDTKATVGLGIDLDTISLGLVYAAPADRPAAFAPFYELEPLALAVAVPPTNGTISSLTKIMGSTGAGQPRHDYRASSIRVDAKLYKEVYAFWRQEALRAREAYGANQTFTIQPITSSVAAQGVAKGGNAMNIPAETHGWWTTLIDWSNAKDDDAVRSVSIKTSQKWKQLGEERNSWLSFYYMNDASRDQNPIASYGADSVAKLKQVSFKYDKGQVFQQLQNGGFLLSKE